MRARLLLPALGAAAVAFGGCGDDENGDEAAAIRCKPAPAGAKEIAVEPRFRAGDRRKVTISKSRKDTVQKGEVRASGEAELSVVEGGPRKAVLRWTAGQVSLPLPEGVDAGAVKKFEEEGERVDVEYATNERGTFERIRNLPEVKAQVGRMLDLLAELDPKLAEAMGALRTLFQSDDSVQKTMAQDPAILHGAYGLGPAAQRPRAVPYELPNPFGPTPIPASARFKLVSPRDANGCAVAELVIDPDPEELVEIMTEVLKKIGGGRKVPARALEGVELRNTARFTYDPGSGWVLKVDAVKSQTLAGRTRTDRTVVTTAPG
jgi:hypothetical protein